MITPCKERQDVKVEITNTTGINYQTDTITGSINNAANTTNNTSAKSAAVGANTFAAVFEKALSGVTKTHNGYAYVDKYGFSHVVKSYETAARFARPETEIFGYNGAFELGYALNPDTGNRLALPIPGSIAYGNGPDAYENLPVEYRNNNMIAFINTENDDTPGSESERYPALDTLPNLQDFLARFPDYLSLLPLSYRDYQPDLANWA
jgi:hypothetical protein